MKEIKMNEMFYYIDENNNKWSKKYFSMEDAKKYSQELIKNNCKDCTGL